MLKLRSMKEVNWSRQCIVYNLRTNCSLCSLRPLYASSADLTRTWCSFEVGLLAVSAIDNPIVRRPDVNTDEKLPFVDGNGAAVSLVGGLSKHFAK